MSVIFISPMLSENEKKVIGSIQRDIPVNERPYREIARSLEMDESTLLEILRGLMEKGVIRRFGATLRHQRSGFKANAMVAWQVDEERVGEVGPLMASFDSVSHCYRRDPTSDWPYNLYTMIHAVDEDTCHRIVREMSQRTHVDRYTLLFSRTELKKTSMEYFPTDDDD